MGARARLSLAEGSAAAPRVLIAAASNGARGCESLAAALAVCAADETCAALLVDVGAGRARRPTLLASAAARDCESRLGGTSGGAAARGLICHLAAKPGEDGIERAVEAAAKLPDCAACVVRVDASLWQATLEHPRLRPRAALLRAELPRDRALAALAVRDLRGRGLAVRIATRPLAWAPARRALAGVRPGGMEEARLRRWAALLLGAGPRERGQALPALLGGITILLVAALAIASIAGALTGKGRLQRAADLSALSAARSMRDEMPRVTAPPLLPDGAPNPAHIDRALYLSRARAAAFEAAKANDADPRRLRVTFPGTAFPPLRVRVDVVGELRPAAAPRARATEVLAYAVAEAAAPAGAGAAAPELASGGGYSGSLVYRQGEGMRPDVGRAFDRMAAAAAGSGTALIVNSGFRSDAEQAQLFAQHPDPTWVAPPGHSLHRCATELDLGPASAYGWLAANAGRFGFRQRYSWEPWHYGYSAGPPPCSRAADRTLVAGVASDKTSGGPGRLGRLVRGPAGVCAGSLPRPDRAGCRALERLRGAARRPADGRIRLRPLRGLSGRRPGHRPVHARDRRRLRAPRPFRPRGGNRRPGTPDVRPAAPLRLRAARARRLQRRRGRRRPCACVPGYPETIAYVAHILALLDGSGALLSPPFEVRLVA